MSVACGRGAYFVGAVRGFVDELGRPAVDADVDSEPARVDLAKSLKGRQRFFKSVTERSPFAT